MKTTLFFLIVTGFTTIGCRAQQPGLLPAVNRFINTLDKDQKLKATYPFESEERFNFHFFPKEDRKGISVNELSPAQKDAAMALLKTCLSKEGFDKSMAIMQLETVLKALEKRAPDNRVRDPGKYFFTIFGVPGDNTIWGWRLEGHHITFNFSARNKNLISGTPGFLGTNPGIVLEGPQKGTQILKEEADMGFALLNSLSPDESKKAFVDTTAPNEIITFIKRKANIDTPGGITYAELTASNQQQLLQLVKLYVHRYTKSFADQMLREIQEAGLDNLRFLWVGAKQPEIGKAHYYRIVGPTIIIEYDNSQNNANHVHSVVRDLKHDFGGDELVEHYKKSHENFNSKAH